MKLMDVQATVEIEGHEFTLAENRWRCAPGLGHRALRIAAALNEMPPLGYQPDRVLGLAEQARDMFGAKIIFVREQAEDPDADSLIY
jgi:hypothetical protein